VFDRGAPMPKGGHLEQADATAWMAFYCSTMLSIAIELAAEDPAYEDVASKFFEHFMSIMDSMNHFDGRGLWDEEDGFYYDQLLIAEQSIPLRIRSLVGLIPLIAIGTLDEHSLAKLPNFRRRFEWFLRERPQLAKHIARRRQDTPKDDHDDGRSPPPGEQYLLAVPYGARLKQVLRFMLDENEFLSPYGIRSLSKAHAEHPFVLRIDSEEFSVDYAPGDSTTAHFGGNSNWRGPIWFPMNFLIVEALEKLHHFYGDSFTVEYPTGSGRELNLKEIARDLAERLTKLFLPDQNGNRPCHGGDARYKDDPHFRDLILFYEHFHGETGAGVGASHQTGWTALVAACFEKLR
jgi:Glycosyl hydrolase family 63 C-terminal domain